MGNFSKANPRRIITAKSEHKCVLQSCQRLQENGFEVIFLKEIGYEITVAEIETKNIDINKRYYYDHDFGFKEVNHNIDLATSITGEDLKLLMDNNLASITKIDNIRLIIRSIFQRLSIGKKIKSYELF